MGSNLYIWDVKGFWDRTVVFSLNLSYNLRKLVLNNSWWSLKVILSLSCNFKCLKGSVHTTGKLETWTSFLCRLLVFPWSFDSQLMKDVSETTHLLHHARLFVNINVHKKNFSIPRMWLGKLWEDWMCWFSTKRITQQNISPVKICKNLKMKVLF